MRIAVACDGLAIARHFAQTTSYMCYTADRDTVIGCSNVPAFEKASDKVPAFLRAIEADALITGAIEEDLAKLFESQGIRVRADVEGDPLTAVREYLAQAVKTVTNPVELAYNH